MKGGTVLIAVVAGVLITAALLTRHHDTPATPAGPASFHGGDAGHPDVGPRPAEASPSTVAVQGLTAIFSWQPAIDPTPGAALTRARAWLTGPLADAADSPGAPYARLPAAWASWRRSADIVTATVRADPAPACRRDHCAVTARLTQTVLHRDGTTTPYTESPLEATLARTPDGWRLASYRITT